MLLEDGKGSGRKAHVTGDGLLRTYAQAESEISHQSENHGLAFSWTASADIDATDSILWLRNDDTARNLIIEDILISSNAAGSWFVYCPVNVTPDGTTVTGVNLNRGSGVVALATGKRDNTQGSVANYIVYGHSAANELVDIHLYGALILGYLDCVAIDITTEPALAQATILGYFHTPE